MARKLVGKEKSKVKDAMDFASRYPDDESTMHYLGHTCDTGWPGEQLGRRDRDYWKDGHGRGSKLYARMIAENNNYGDGSPMCRNLSVRRVDIYEIDAEELRCWSVIKLRNLGL